MDRAAPGDLHEFLTQSEPDRTREYHLIRDVGCLQRPLPTQKQFQRTCYLDIRGITDGHHFDLTHLKQIDALVLVASTTDEPSNIINISRKVRRTYSNAPKHVSDNLRSIHLQSMAVLRKIGADDSELIGFQALVELDCASLSSRDSNPLLLAKEGKLETLRVSEHTEDITLGSAFYSVFLRYDEDSTAVIQDSITTIQTALDSLLEFGPNSLSMIPSDDGIRAGFSRPSYESQRVHHHKAIERIIRKQFRRRTNLQSGDENAIRSIQQRLCSIIEELVVLDNPSHIKSSTSISTVVLHNEERFFECLNEHSLSQWGGAHGDIRIIIPLRPDLENIWQSPMAGIFHDFVERTKMSNTPTRVGCDLDEFMNTIRNWFEENTKEYSGQVSLSPRTIPERWNAEVASLLEHYHPSRIRNIFHRWSTLLKSNNNYPKLYSPFRLSITSPEDISIELTMAYIACVSLGGVSNRRAGLVIDGSGALDKFGKVPFLVFQFGT